MKSWQNFIFRKVHANFLIYNTCWEDPRCDRALLNLDPNSEIVMITSAGCNALEYLLDRPAKIHCVDLNPRQNALLLLKLAAFQNGKFEDLFQLFGDGYHPRVQSLYSENLRAFLPDYAQAFWDKNLDFFDGKGFRKSMYYRGTSGVFAWFISKYCRAKKHLWENVVALLRSDNLDAQLAYYNEVEKFLRNKFMKWILNRHLTMCLIGVPKSQQDLFVREYEDGALGFIREQIRYVFTKLPVSDNYFWKVYIDGKYSRTCCPTYLKEEYFETIRSQYSKIQVNTSSMSAFLKTHPGKYSHFVLLDHQDWMASHNRPSLEEEWKLILENSRSGTKILLRSANKSLRFLPEFIHEAVEFDEEACKKVHPRDRVGTYASVHLATVK